MGISNEIERIVNKQAGGYWDITKSDVTFIRHMKQLLALISEKAKPELDTLIANLCEQALSVSESKLKVVFLTQETYCWPSFESVYRACDQDERYTAQLVYIPFSHPNVDETIDYFTVYKEKMGLPIARHNEYSISEESPDVAFIAKPYDLIPMQYHIDEVEKAVGRSIYVSYGLEITSYYSEYLFGTALHNKAWRFIVYGDMVRQLALKYSKCEGRNIVAWGHPRADCYISFKEKRDSIPPEWKERIAGRKTVLWNSHQTVKPNEGYGTFFKWKDELLSFFYNNRNVFLLWRPHPFMSRVIINDGYMTEAELKELESELISWGNVIIDKSNDYLDAVYASDAIITDGTSFCLEYLYSGNPLLLTYKPLYDDKTGESLESLLFEDDIFKGEYVALEQNDVTSFLEMVMKNEDPKKNERMELTRKLFTNNPEGNGEHIKNRIYDEIRSEEIEAGGRVAYSR